MTTPRPPFEFDVSSALGRGRRSYQEDAVITDFARGAETGLAVLADGMGGHAAGDVASKIVVTEVFSELMFQRGDTEGFESGMRDSLQAAAMAANACLQAHVEACPETRGMGATLVAAAVVNRNLYWISIGDSPLFLFRDGALRQLNEDHSMAPQIDFMVKSGLIAPEAGRGHPDRNTLTSVLFGAQVPKIDCPAEPLELRAGDLLIVASDGLQFLSDAEIAEVLAEAGDAPSAAIADRLMKRLEGLDDPDQDNVSFALVKVTDAVPDVAPVAFENGHGASEVRRAG